MFIFSRLKTYLAVSAIILGAFLVGYLRGGRDAESDYEQENDQYLIDVLQKNRKVEDEIDALDDVGLGKRATRWLRNADHG